MVTLKDPPPTLRPGLNATADITTDRKAKVLAVPIQAVVVRAGRQGGQGRSTPARRRPAEPESRPVAGREKGEEKDGVFVVDDRQGRSSGR